jgi:hypothetical protein
MREGWCKIELTDELRIRPLPDAVFQVRHEFLQRHAMKEPKATLLLANFELDRPEQLLPAVLYYYLSPPAVGMLQYLLSQYGARPCPEPSLGDTHFIAGDKDYFLLLQTDNRHSREEDTP